MLPFQVSRWTIFCALVFSLTDKSYSIYGHGAIQVHEVSGYTKLLITRGLYGQHFQHFKCITDHSDPSSSHVHFHAVVVDTTVDRFRWAGFSSHGEIDPTYYSLLLPHTTYYILHTTYYSEHYTFRPRADQVGEPADSVRNVKSWLLY